MPRAKQKDSAVELAEKMVQTLETQRGLGPGSYPVILGRLAELADGQAAPELIAKAIKKKSFKDRVALAKLDKTTSLAVLASDHALLADDPRLLESALQAAYPKKPVAQSVARIVTKVAPDLRGPFEEAVHRRIREKALPTRIGVLDVEGSPRLYWRDRPPEVVAVAELAVTLVQTLEALRGRGPEHYPPALKQLIEMGAPHASPRVLKKVLAGEAFKKAIVLAVPRHPETPVALAADVDRLAGSRQLLEFLLSRAAKPALKAFPLKDLKKPLMECLRQPFVDAVNWNIDRGKLPPGVGYLWIKARYLFFARDVHGNLPGSAATPGPNAASDGTADFAAAFAAAFEQLDRQAGGRNFVSLVDLRRALPLPRVVFDGELFKLRQAGYYSVSAAEGRHGISPEERDAGIPEEGSLLLFVSRNAS